MTYKLTITAPSQLEGSAIFESKEEATKFTNTLQALMSFETQSCFYCQIVKVVSPLLSWAPDQADITVMRALLERGDKVETLKFVRAKTGAGLKESRDWLAVNFAEDYRPDPRY